MLSGLDFYSRTRSRVCGSFQLQWVCQTLRSRISSMLATYIISRLVSCGDKSLQFSGLIMWLHLEQMEIVGLTRELSHGATSISNVVLTWTLIIYTQLMLSMMINFSTHALTCTIRNIYNIGSIQTIANRTHHVKLKLLHFFKWKQNQKKKKKSNFRTLFVVYLRILRGLISYTVKLWMWVSTVSVDMCLMIDWQPVSPPIEF